MRELSIFIDESGSDGLDAPYYILALVLHEQGDSLAGEIAHYDDGQRSIARAIHGAVDYALSKNAVVFRKASPSDYRLGQAADYICTVELAALRYRDKQTTPTDGKFFGSWSQFKKGILKEVRAKRM